MKINLVKEFGIDPMPELKEFFYVRHIQDKMIASWLGDTYPVAVGRWFSDNKIPDKYKERMDSLKYEIIEWEKIYGKVFNHVLSDNNMVSKKIGPPTPKRKTGPPTLKNKQVREHTYID